MSGMGLTHRQRELLIYIQERELCPSFEEMRDALGYVSKDSIFKLLNALEERGHIRRLPNRARAIEVTRSPSPRLRVVFGPGHCEDRARARRASYAAEQQAA